MILLPMILIRNDIEHNMSASTSTVIEISATYPPQANILTEIKTTEPPARARSQLYDSYRKPELSDVY